MCTEGDDQAEVLMVPTKRTRVIDGRLYTISKFTQIVNDRAYELIDGRIMNLLPHGKPKATPLFDQATISEPNPKPQLSCAEEMKPEILIS